ncbi:MAG: guanylate kinase [Bernardetiaceae bacterium]|nr:guanylate kinase [Bernardetiaceae bacterium]
MQKLIIFSAPSGAGKTTIVQALLKRLPFLGFSVSATTRPPRPNEVEGVDYYFLSVDEFKKRIQNEEFAEYEQVYENLYYGTLKSEIKRLWKNEKIAIFDVDVKGGQSLKKHYPKESISFFVQPPSLEALQSRLQARNTESKEAMQERLEKAAHEVAQYKHFDHVIVNDKLEVAIAEAQSMIESFVYA